VEVLSDADRARTHIFSSFFYRRLTQKQSRGMTLEATANKTSVSAEISVCVIPLFKIRTRVELSDFDFLFLMSCSYVDYLFFCRAVIFLKFLILVVVLIVNCNTCCISIMLCSVM